MPTVYWPYSGNRKVNGPGPKKQVRVRRDRWSCKCKREGKRWSVCKCVARRTAKGKPSRATKTVRIDLEKKKKYRPLWQKHRKAIREKEKRIAAQQKKAAS